ncbi:SPOR domain-containing protein [Litchfieldella xinjiangensis]|uniref:SPOR domain-containing protein n=1 Tax=Litchfieldella xinjiangensis TaxID=1166948 RepID=UPI0005BE3E75|nr:SPOR domain-containing protein [Halomonas xinjiangensis]
MKYGMRERLSGAVIVIALGVIFIPMLFDEPAPREERPRPVLTIEQPIEVERRSVPEPEPPTSLGDIRPPQPLVNSRGSLEVAEPEQDAPAAEATPSEASGSSSSQSPGEAASRAAPEPNEQAPSQAPSREQPPAQDPIADLARAAEERERQSQSSNNPTATAGDWAVQAGSFGEPANAERLESQLRELGFDAYRRQREGGLTSVYVGPFSSSDAGEQARGQLKERANIQGLLVRVRED